MKMNGKYIQAAIVPVAKPATLLAFGLSPYIDGINDDMEHGIERFYIMGAHGNIIFAKQVFEGASTVNGLTKVWENEFRGTYRNRKNKLYCACLVKK